MKIALFVDFDNVYTGLQKISIEAAERFSRQPLNWLHWLVSAGVVEGDQNVSGERRRILVRRCYLNPVAFHRYRRAFHEAGFEIVDCPPMTATGKTSTDIHLVLDTMDALLDDTRFDEFIVFSADADFSPLLRRLRRHDRRTVVFAAGAMSESYKASADRVIDIQTFLRDALRLAPVEDESFDDVVEVDIHAGGDLRERVVDSVRKRVLQAATPVQLASLAQLLQREFPTLREGNWCGAGSFGNLLRQIQLPEIIFDFHEGTAIDRGRMERNVSGSTTTATSNSETSGPPAISPQAHSLQPLNEAAELIVRQAVAESKVPVHLAVLAQQLRRHLPQLGEGWSGATTFAGFLRQLRISPLEQATLENGTTAVLFDPGRHEAPTGVVGDKLVQGMLRAAEIPEIKAADFVRILNVARSHMGGAEPFEITQVSRKVAATLAAQSFQVSARRVSVVLQALIFGGLDATRVYEAANDLMYEAMGVVISAWSRETQTVADDDARARLIDWLSSGGGLVPGASPVSQT